MEVLVEFKECPDCKVDKRLMHGIVAGEIAKGNMGPDVVGCAKVEVVANVDPLNPPIAGGRVPGARVLKDICKKCGKEFTTKIEIGHITFSRIPGQPPTFA